MKQKKTQPTSNAKIAVVFFAFIIFTILVSSIVKIVAVVRNGQVDDSKRFTLRISSGNNVEVMSLSPSSKNITIFKFNGKIIPEDAGKLLEIPVDGFIAFKSPFDLNQKPSALFMSAINSYRKLSTNLTIVDVFRLEMLTRSISDNSVGTINVGGGVDGLISDQIVGNLVNDDFIEKDNQTIQIINGTDVIGLGNRLAKLITNMGGNVIIVATSDSIKNKSTISYIEQENYTVKKLQKVLGYEVVKDPGSAIADITIVIGEDKVNSSPF